jgi:hypothetical protein
MIYLRSIVDYAYGWTTERVLVTIVTSNIWGGDGGVGWESVKQKDFMRFPHVSYCYDLTDVTKMISPAQQEKITAFRRQNNGTAVK